ncbi:MAG: ATP-dependent helicase, partial [Bacteroidetes bacterium]|nr:ATP-dependent helicase [Bacteroidota bacterium]
MGFDSQVKLYRLKYRVFHVLNIKQYIIGLHLNKNGMAITQQQIQQAELIQIAAAQDINPTIRLVAGPGTGKSKVIERRVNWLTTTQNVQPGDIIAVSFTRAASRDLKRRINNFNANVPNIQNLRVSTLHSLALYVLKRTGNLNFYPADPLILDNWELKEIIDAEFSTAHGCTSTRSEEIRREHEAYWSTGNWNPPNLPAANPAITPAERANFHVFHQNRTQLYSCVLPGEIVRACVQQINLGHIDPVAVLGVRHLIVDEVQDLNPCDFEFINSLANAGVNVFICGDDDQSVYSFRYAFPQGIQNFVINYPNSTNHVLNHCFRCTTTVLQAADTLIRT